MLSLVFDTETTGKYRYDLPPSAPEQPDVVQLCAVMFDDETPTTALNLFIHGDTDIPPEATEIHRIDRRMTERVGVSRRLACQMFARLVEKADVLVGHNVSFDISVMRTAIQRENGTGQQVNKTSYCTMQNATDLCKLPKKPYNGVVKPGFKWPTLQETYQILVDPRGFDGAHDAYADVKATAEIYRVLRREGH